MLPQPSSYTAFPESKDNMADAPTADVLLPQAQDNEKQGWTNIPSWIICMTLTALPALTAPLRVCTTPRVVVTALLLQKKRNKMVPFPLGTHLFFHLEPRPPQWSGWFRIATQPHPHTSRPCPSQQKWENELYPSQNQDTHALLVLISIIRKYIRLVYKLGLCVTVVFIVNSTESFLNLFKLGYQWSAVKFKCW